MGTLPLTNCYLVLIWQFWKKTDSIFLSLSQLYKKISISLEWNDGLLVFALAVSLSWYVVNEVTIENTKMLVSFFLWQMWCCRAVGWFSTDMNSVFSPQNRLLLTQEKLSNKSSLALIRTFFRSCIYYVIHQFFSGTWMKSLKWCFAVVIATYKGAQLLLLHAFTNPPRTSPQLW